MGKKRYADIDGMVIHGTGCCLMDFLYTGTDFSGDGFRAFASLREGDGGLTPGRLVFAEDIERFSGKDYAAVLAEITGGAAPDSRSIGGPSIVSLIHAAQALYGRGHRIRYYGARGTDTAGTMLAAALQKLPLDCSALTVKEGLTARTDVLSDPRYDNGRGERTFIHTPGGSSLFAPDDLEKGFFDAEITAFGGTALVPALHNGLTELLKKARLNGAVTAVNLVYDYPHERRFPGQKWRLGLHDDGYRFIDLLIADRDEALKTSGQASTEAAVQWLLAQGTGAVIVTHGPEPITLAAGAGLFAPLPLRYMPVYTEMRSFSSAPPAAFPPARAVSSDSPASLADARAFASSARVSDSAARAAFSSAAAAASTAGDTTGCGDNFAGALLAALAERLPVSRGRLDLRELCVPAVIAGGFACFTVGGVFYETYPGEKQERLAPYTEAYRRTFFPRGFDSFSQSPG